MHPGPVFPRRGGWVATRSLLPSGGVAVCWADVPLRSHPQTSLSGGRCWTAGTSGKGLLAQLVSTASPAEAPGHSRASSAPCRLCPPLTCLWSFPRSPGLAPGDTSHLDVPQTARRNPTLMPSLRLQDHPYLRQTDTRRSLPANLTCLARLTLSTLCNRGDSSTVPVPPVPFAQSAPSFFQSTSLFSWNLQFTYSHISLRAHTHHKPGSSRARVSVCFGHWYLSSPGQSLAQSRTAGSTLTVASPWDHPFLQAVTLLPPFIWVLRKY